MQKKINTNIGFSDSQLVSYKRTGDEFVVLLNAWNGSHLMVQFPGFEAAIDRGLDNISDFIEETENTSFFQQIISQVFTAAPVTHPFHLFQFIGLDGEPMLEVIATSVTVSAQT